MAPTHFYRLEQLAALDCLTRPVWVFDIERCALVWANREAVRLWGAEDLPALQARDFSSLSEAARQRLEGYLERFRQGKQVQEQWTFYPQGKATTVRCHCSGLWLAQEKGARLVMLVEGQVLENEEAHQDALRSIEALRHTPALITLFSPAGTALMQNPAAQHAYGLPGEGNSFTGRLVDEAEGERLLSRILGGERLRVEVQVVTRQGRRWHALDARLTTDPASGSPVVLTSETDISDRVEAEALLRVRSEELRAALLAQAEESRERGLLLTNIGEGLVTLDRSGRLAPERSAAFSAWFGPHRDGITFWDCLAPLDPQASVRFRRGWEALQEDVLPLEVTLAQLPTRIRIGERTLQIDYRPIWSIDASSASTGTGPPERMMLVLRDVSAALAQERLEAEQRELFQAVDQLLQNTDGFRDFFEDAEALVAAVTRTEPQPPGELRRLVHTLKGNSAAYGLHSIASLCHEIEERLGQSDGGLAPEDREELARRWRLLSARLGVLLGRAVGRIELGEDEYRALLAAVEEGESRERLLRRIRAWRLQPLRSKLEHLAAQARGLCHRLGKGPLQVVVHCGALRVAPEPVGPFFAALVHVVRNAVDHGLEPPEERLQRGKPAEPRMHLGGYLAHDALVVEVGDDGRGIDWERLRERAAAAGLPARTQEDLIAALFADGVSTKECVTELSGRGVGMAAVRAACEALGGRVQLQTTPGRGTTFQFYLPAHLVA